ncbi:MAG TPA: helix-turn-helix transcriptional regulator [Candidatus Angelobacter sp.]|nr:helix-turn-helix transcriptional regulator [Candidatus Angelobacter sp.]
MIVGERLRSVREQKQLSQGDIEKRSGLLRCYISRVENGHTVPAVETLEKLARALEIPMYELLYEGEEPPKPPTMSGGAGSAEKLWGASGKEARYLRKLQQCLSRMNETDRNLLLFTVAKMTKQKKSSKSN